MGSRQACGSGGGGRLEQRGQEDVIQGSEEEDLSGEAWGSLAWNMGLPLSWGLSEALYPLLPSGV